MGAGENPQRASLVKRVLASWFSRGDYRADSLERLEQLEGELDPRRTTWIEYSDGVRSAAIRMYDGTRAAILDGRKSPAPRDSSATPTERKFPGIEVRRDPDQPVIELGLLDIQHGVDDGVGALFHQVAKILKRDYLDSHAAKGRYGGADEPNVIAIARPANVRLYQARYGFKPYLLANGTPLKTSTGMDVLEMPVAHLVARYYGKRIYPRTRGEPDYWSAFWKSQHERLDDARGLANKVANHILELQSDGFLLPARIDRNVNASLKRMEWYERIDGVGKLLLEEDFIAFERALHDVRQAIWSWEPVVTQKGSIPMRIGSGPFGFTHHIEYTQWNFRHQTIEFMAFTGSEGR